MKSYTVEPRRERDRVEGAVRYAAAYVNRLWGWEVVAYDGEGNQIGEAEYHANKAALRLNWKIIKGKD